MTTFKNLTPQTIVINDKNGLEVKRLARSGTVAFVREGYPEVTERFDNIPILSRDKKCVLQYIKNGAIHTGFPEPEPGVAYIVTDKVAALVNGRSDVFTPGRILEGKQGVYNSTIRCIGLFPANSK